MTRDPQALANRHYDLLIVGGGIYGAAALWDASLRGLKAALIERDDFGSQTSSNSLKIIHGGLRYIQHLDYKRMRESIRERRVLMHIAPHLVHPLKCLMPTYGHLGKGPEALRIALKLNDWVGFDRNHIDDPQKHLPGGEIVAPETCLSMIPGIRQENLTGGAIWYDCQVYNSERFLMAYLRSSEQHGAVLANYVEARDFINDDGRVTGVKAVDRMTGEPLEIRADLVLNAAGPWLNEMMGWIQPDKENIQYSWAMNLVTRSVGSDCAAGVTGKRLKRVNGEFVEMGNKVFFITPWRDYSLIGTVHEAYEGDPADFRITEDQIEHFLAEINYALPDNQLRREDVYFHYAGLLPMDRPDEKSGEVVLTKHYRIYDHAALHGVDGVISVLGVKYTTARDVAIKAIDLAVKKLAHNRVASRTDETRVFGGNIHRFDDFAEQTRIRLESDFSEDVIRQLIRNYGSEYGRILKYGEENDAWLKTIPGTPVLGAEIVHAVREEMAQHLTDAVWRRSELGSAGDPGEVALRAAAEIMADECDWSPQTLEDEIEKTRSDYKSANYPPKSLPLESSPSVHP